MDSWAKGQMLELGVAFFIIMIVFFFLDGSNE